MALLSMLSTREIHNRKFLLPGLFASFSCLKNSSTKTMVALKNAECSSELSFTYLLQLTVEKEKLSMLFILGLIYYWSNVSLWSQIATMKQLLSEKRGKKNRIKQAEEVFWESCSDLGLGSSLQERSDWITLLACDFTTINRLYSSSRCYLQEEYYLVVLYPEGIKLARAIHVYSL